VKFAPATPPTGFETAVQAMAEMDDLARFLPTTRRQYVRRVIGLLRWGLAHDHTAEQIRTAEGFAKLCVEYATHMRDEGYVEATVQSYLKAFGYFAEANSIPPP
jgi:hypothetical protein